MTTDYTTRDSNLAQYLIYLRRRCRCYIGPDDLATFSFEDGHDLRDEVAAYLHGAQVPAVAYGDAGRIVRSLILGARHGQRGGIVRRSDEAGR